MLRIITFRDPGSGILFRPAKKIGVFDKKLQRLARDMGKTLLGVDGLGLAAPQVGKELAICAIKNGKTVDFLCNPEVVNKSEEKDKMEEGCLSFPNVFLDIIRPKAITVAYQDLDGNKKKADVTGILARAMQHEIDHLNGVAFIERA